MFWCFAWYDGSSAFVDTVLLSTGTLYFRSSFAKSAPSRPWYSRSNRGTWGTTRGLWRLR